MVENSIKIIVRTFKQSCICNCIDVSEDDFVYEEDINYSAEVIKSVDYMHPSIPKSESEFYEQFGNSDSTDFEGFIWFFYPTKVAKTPKDKLKY